MRKIIRRCLPLLLLLAAPAAFADSPLADKFPDNTLVYIGWRGSDALAPAYNLSHLKAVADAAETAKFLDALIQRATVDSAGDPGRIALIDLLTKVGQTVFKYPTAIYFGGMTHLDAAKPTPKLACVVKCGADAPALAARLKTVFEADKNRKPDEPQPAASVIGDYLLVTVGDGDDIAARLSGIAEKPVGPSLAANKNFKVAEEKTGKDPAFMIYANTEGGLKLVDDLVAAKGPPDAKTNWPKVADALGIDSLKFAAVSGNFDGADWAQHMYIAMGDHRSGVLSLLDNAPLSADAWKMIPKEAVFAGAVRLNGDRILKEVRDAAARVDDNAQRRIDTGMQTFTNFTGVDLQKDILANFTDELLFYGVTDPAGGSLKNITLVCKAKDGAALEKALGDLEAFVASMAPRDGGLKVTVDKGDDFNMHNVVWKTGGFSWTVQKNVWILALDPDRVKAAAAHIAKAGPSILENPEFTAAIKTPEKYSSFSFTDLHKTAPEAYLLLADFLNQALTEGTGGKITFKLPDFEKIKPHLGTATILAWSDADGFHVDTREPFPAASDLGGIGEAGIWVQKATFEARQSAVRVAASTNLRQIGQSVMIYAADNKDQLPPDINKLLKNHTIKPAIMVKDRSKLPGNWADMTGDEQAAWAIDHADYIYIGKGKIADNTPETVIAYEKYPEGATGKIAVLFGDTHVDSMTIPDLVAQIKKQADGPVVPLP